MNSPNTAKRILDRESFLKRAVIREVSLADGAVVCIRALPAGVIVAGGEEAKKAFEPANLLTHSLCDENGARLFAEEETDLALTIDHSSLSTLMKEILDLNGLRPVKNGEAEDAEKN